jgi:serine/threonine protein kinase
VSRFGKALEAFQAGELDFTGLDSALQSDLANGGASPAELLRELEHSYSSGRFPPQLYVILKSRIEASGSATGAAVPPPGSRVAAAEPDDAAADDADRTRVMTPGNTPPTPESGPSADRTVVTGSPPPAAPESGPSADRTVVTGSPPPATPGAATTGSITGSGEATSPTTGTGAVTGSGGTTGTAGGAGDATVLGTSAPEVITSRTSRTGGTDSSNWSDLPAAGGEGGETLQPGAVLKGRFVLEELIGRGGMGEVYKARDQRKEEAQDRHPWVAVKILNESFKSHPESLKALQRESRKAQKLAHPNIVNVHDFDRDGANVFMTMEFLEGEPLDHVTKRNRGRGMPEGEAMPIIRDMGRALAHAHSHGIVHSDFKPGNAFLTKEGVTKVFDFGIARASSHAGKAEGETTVFDAGELGALTPAYASYEMLEGDEPDARDDIYALACVAYELLAGRHPFNKVPANQALEKGMVPERIRSLSRSQWKALARGLAFRREKRSANVAEFLSGIERKRVHKGVVFGAAAAVLLLVGLAVMVVPGYLHDRRITQLVRELKQADDTGMPALLASVRGLGKSDRAGVLLNAKNEIIAWYGKRQDALVNEVQGRYDYPAALKNINAALQLYPDSAQLTELKTRLENSRDQLLNDLTRRFNSHLEEGRLLASPGDDMEDVLHILAQVQPDHPLLHDARLSAAYADQASHLLEQGNLERADQMLALGLKRFPQDTQLVNLHDKVAAEQTRVRREKRIAALSGQLATALAGMDSLDAVERVRADLTELRQLAPDAAVAGKIEARAGKLVDKQLSTLIDDRHWDDADRLLQANADVVSTDFLQTRQKKLADAHNAHLARLDKLYTALLDAVGKRRLAGKSSNSAQSLLDRLAGEGADAALLERARAAIGQGYLEMVRAARAAGKWDEARAHVQEGLDAQPGAAVSASLQAELAQIGQAEAAQKQQLAEAEIKAREAERQQQVSLLHQSFQQSLEQQPYQTDTARQSLGILDKLAALNPSDPLIGQGRNRIAERLTASIRALDKQQDWDKALAMATTAVDMVPGSETLSSVLLEVQRGRSQHLAQARVQNIDSYRQSLAQALANPVLDDDWTGTVQNDMKMLGELVPKDEVPWLEQQRAKVASLYLDKARVMRGKERFTEARSLLAAAGKFVSDDTAVRKEQQALADAEAKFNEANKEKLRLAHIEGDKQTFLTQARARDVSNAKKTLAILHGELAANDPFLNTTAPEALGTAYLRLAESAAKKRNFSTAVKLADAGLAEAPGMAELQKAKQGFEREGRVDVTRRLIQTAGSLGTAQVQQSLARLKADSSVDYRSVEQDLSGVAARRIRALAGKDYSAAEAMLADARQLFPGNRQLAALKLKRPAAPAPATPARPAQVTPATPPVVTARVTPATGGVACKPTLAGYGRRARGTCYDMLASDTHGPLLVVIPSGGGIKGPYAITKYEISVADYNHYCKLSGKCAGVRAASPELPVTGITLRQVKAYAAWMSRQTGHTYRLPTDQEWSYAASAQGKQPGKDFNCRVMLGDSMIKGQGLVKVDVGSSNGWGLINYIGNAQEWVTTARGTAARGGDYQDNLSACDLSLIRAHAGQADAVTGFRLVRTLEMGG